MAIVVYVVSKTRKGGDALINGITGMVLAIDNVVDNNVTKILERAITVCTNRGHPLPVNYFDTVTPATSYNIAGETTIFGEIQTQFVV